MCRFDFFEQIFFFFLPQDYLVVFERAVYLTIRSLNFFNIHHHSLKPKAFPNQDRERGVREGTEGRSGAQKNKTKQRKKRGDTQSNETLVLQVHSSEKENERYEQT